MARLRVVGSRRGRGRCAYCFDVLAAGEQETRCEGCGTFTHSECRDELDGCPTLGCAEAGSRSVTREPEEHARARIAAHTRAPEGLRSLYVADTDIRFRMMNDYLGVPGVVLLVAITLALAVGFAAPENEHLLPILLAGTIVTAAVGVFSHMIYAVFRDRRRVDLHLREGVLRSWIVESKPVGDPVPWTYEVELRSREKGEEERITLDAWKLPERFRSGAHTEPAYVYDLGDRTSLLIELPDGKLIYLRP